MKLPRNAFKAALKKPGLKIGLWSNLKSPMVAEILSNMPFDWVVVDMEHGPNDLGDVVAQLQAGSATSVAQIVRPPWNDRVMIKRVLDAGVQSLVIPYVQNAEEARQAVASTRYPPEGARGVAGGSRATRFGLVDNYHANADKELCLIVQAETAEAVANIPEIAGVRGVDAIFVGPADLAASMGHLGNFDHEDVQAKIAEAAKAIKAAGKFAGILSFNPEQAMKYAALGYDFIAVASDQSLLVSAAQSLAAKFDRLRG
jgi:4-hydroxy-2-oxoheptanedioate aldolase